MKKIVKIVSNIVNKMEPTQIMVIGFAIVILIGAILLSMPISTQNGESIGFLDALFTSTSAVCVTGLIAVDTSTYWSFFGQLIIIKRINLKERLLIQESLNQIDLSGLVKLTRYILLTTFFIEGTGALLLSTVFIPQFGILNGIWYSIFHAISAFCNAGFDLMG